MTLEQYTRAIPHIAACARAHASLQSLRRITAHEYETAEQLAFHLATLEAEIRLLATGHEHGCHDGSTRKERVEAAQAVVAIIDGVPDSHEATP